MEETEIEQLSKGIDDGVPFPLYSLGGLGFLKNQFHEKKPQRVKVIFFREIFFFIILTLTMKTEEMECHHWFRKRKLQIS